jgi:RHS repeat-associated protein
MVRLRYGAYSAQSRLSVAIHNMPDSWCQVAKNANGTANIVSLSDYYPYGLDMPGRTFVAEAYRYGYQGSERDPETLGGSGYTTFFRALDPRIGRWLTPDPKVFPWQSPYCSMDCNPVAMTDVLGDKGRQIDQKTANEGGGEEGDYYKDVNGKTFEHQGMGSDGRANWVLTTPPTSSANTPANNFFANDATFVFNMYDDYMKWGKCQSEDEPVNNTWFGSGSKVDWDGMGLNIFSSSGIGFGSPIYTDGPTWLVKQEDLPFSTPTGGLSNGYGPLLKIEYLQRGGSSTLKLATDVVDNLKMGVTATAYGETIRGWASQIVDNVSGNVTNGVSDKPEIQTSNAQQIDCLVEVLDTILIIQHMTSPGNPDEFVYPDKVTKKYGVHDTTDVYKVQKRSSGEVVNTFSITH